MMHILAFIAGTIDYAAKVFSMWIEINFNDIKTTIFILRFYVNCFNNAMW